MSSITKKYSWPLRVCGEAFFLYSWSGFELSLIHISEPTSQGHLKCEGAFQQGIDKETARKIVKMIKDSKLKVQAAIQDDQVRVTGKKIDDLQAVIAMLKEKDLEIPLQFVNMKD